jgi:hypothetical protein
VRATTCLQIHNGEKLLYAAHTCHVIADAYKNAASCAKILSSVIREDA